VIKAAVADVIGPAVATDDPDRLIHQIIGNVEQGAGFRQIDGCQLLLEQQDTGALLGDGGFTLLLCGEDGFHQFLGQFVGKPDEQLAGIALVLIKREADAKTELGIVLEE